MPRSHRPFVLLLLVLALGAGCGSSDGDAPGATPTATASANPTREPTDPGPLCAVFGVDGCESPSPGPTPTPSLAPCSGANLTACVQACGSTADNSGCCTIDLACFNPFTSGPAGACIGTPAAACQIVPTPTPTSTGTVTVTATPTATGTPTETPAGGIPTPTLPPNTCDAACDDNGPPPGCTPLAPNGDDISGTPPDLIVDTCQVVGSGQYVYRYVHVIDGGMLYFADQGAAIDFRANSILVQQGGRVKAGSWCCPFGSFGGTLDVGLWGIDPTDQGTQPPSTPGIDCVDSTGFPQPCFSHGLVSTPHYCTVPDSDDPCSSQTPPSVGDNALFEGHLDHGAGGLPFDGGAPFGFKVFGVAYGGSLELFGAKGVDPANRITPTPTAAPPTTATPTTADAACSVPAADAQNDPTAWAALSGQSWVRLDATAPAASTTLTLDRSVNWQQGDRLVVTTTDWHASHSEEVILAAPPDGTALTLNAPLAFTHAGEIYDVTQDIADPPSANQEVDTRAAVGLLSRDIRIYSLGDSYDEPFPAAAECGYQGSDDGHATTPAHCYFGGHLIARQGFARFQVQGAEFDQLGQGGRLAHYPVHFHMAKYTGYTDAFVTDSSIHDSLTRFVTIHATHDVTVARNVGFRSIGHGYYIEDGSEIDNLLCHNLAVSVQGSLVEYFEAQEPGSPTARFSPPILPSVSSGPPYGSDSYFPVGFWLMNTWNDLVGNKVVGVGGYGSCYWLLGSGVSGPSQDLQWSTSTTSSAGYADYNQASMRQAPLKRFRGNACSTAQYALQTTLQVDPPIVSAANYGYTPAINPYDVTSAMLPQVGGDYLPVLNGGVGCATQRTTADTGDNASSCSLTLIDRFTTSFNWAPIDFGAIWLRPQFYAFTNGAVTDQLFGGLTFVSGGAWTQAPPGYFTITKDSLYVGSTQPDTPDAGRLGPALDIDACGNNACPLPVDGTATFTQGFQPKRLINIYDGPFFADGNAFTNAPAIECDATAVTDGVPECGIYMSTVQPERCDDLHPRSVKATPTTAGGMCVIDAAVGWKQPNGFYYPPAFAFENTAFDDETVRHNVVDQYNDYIQGTLGNPSKPSTYTPLQTYTGITPIDSSTILNDLDGTFTGTCWGEGCDALPVDDAQRRTSSVSANHFFDAPSQAPECRSYGVQTSPGEFLTSVIAPLTADGTAIDPGVWNLTAPFPAVPIYRQRLLTSETPCGGPVCDGSAWSCNQASFMMGAQNGQAPYLTADGGVYYIDTDAAGQSTSCIPGSNFATAPFAANASYVVYQLFAKNDAKVTYQLYTDGAAGQWVWVQPHLTVAGGMAVTPITGADLLAALDANVTQTAAGILEVTFDSSIIAGAGGLIADQFAFATRDDDEKCIPRDACQISKENTHCELSSSFTDTDLADTVQAICGRWATRVAGTTATSGDLSLSDCPASGCLGYSFTLPTTWTAKSYAEVGANLVTCFPDDDTWNRPLQVISQDSAVCPVPPTPAGLCAAPSPTPTATPEGPE